VREDSPTGALLFGSGHNVFWISFGPPAMYDTLLSGASTSNQYCPAPTIHSRKITTQQRICHSATSGISIPRRNG
jgi:hypothetical protein